MIFEFDPAKSAANQAKHGIDFTEAQDLWSGLTIRVPLNFLDEERHLVIGKIGDKHWAAIVTWRGDKLRLISVRRARMKEERIYETAANEEAEQD